MFFLSKLFPHFLLPPGAFAVLLGLGITLLLLQKRSAGYLVLFFTAFTLYVSSTATFRNEVLGSLENQYPFPDTESLRCEALVGLGGGLNPLSPEENEYPALDGSSMNRTYTIYKLWKKLKKPIVLSGGVALSGKWKVAEAMREFLINLGVPKKDIHVEDESRNTYENLLFTRKLAEKQNWKRLCIVTSAFHMPRTMQVAYSLRIEATPVPTHYLVNGNLSYFWMNYLPTSEGLAGTIIALREYLGLFYYQLYYRI